MFFTKHVSLLSLVPELKNYFVRFYSNTPDFIIRDSVIYVNGFLLFTCRRNKRLSDRIKYYRLLPVIRIPRREKKIFYINKKKKITLHFKKQRPPASVALRWSADVPRGKYSRKCVLSSPCKERIVVFV